MKAPVIFLGILLILSSLRLHGQTFSVPISPKHSAKLNSIQSAEKRLIKYYKFYKKDSARFTREQHKRFKRTIDSAYRAEVKRERIERRLAKQGLPVLSREINIADSLDHQLAVWYVILKDSSSSDSLKQLSKEKIKTLAIEKAKANPGFQHLLEQYQISGDTADWSAIVNQVPGLDFLSDFFNADPETLFKLAEQHGMRHLARIDQFGNLSKEFAEAEKLKNLPDQYRKQYEEYLNPEHWQQEGKQKAVDEALDYFSEHADKLANAQAKMSKLMSKYRELSNGGDLSTAVKHTSMKGKTLFEHLVFGGNFNVVSIEPVSLDLSPQLGHKFTTRFFVGVGMNYRLTFSDSIKKNYYVSPRNTSFRGFSSYDVVKGFFAYGEWEKSGINLKSNDRSANVWKDNVFLGVGRKFLIHPKVYFTVTALYNLNSEDQNPIHPRRFQMRMGFQLSELATRKKRVYYDPNR